MQRRDFLTNLMGTAAGVAASGKLPAEFTRTLPIPGAQSGQNAGPGPQGKVLPDPLAGMKKILAIGDVHTGYQHDSVSHALATIEQMGRPSGDYLTYIRTATHLITKH